MKETSDLMDERQSNETTAVTLVPATAVIFTGNRPCAPAPMIHAIV